jgi:hypothetical protein
MGIGRATIAAGVVFAAALALPAASPAATTIGPPLPGNNLGLAGAGGGATFIQTALPNLINESPIDGVVVRYRVQFGSWGTVRLRVLRPSGGGTFSVVRSGTAQSIGTVFDEVLRPFDTRVPISQGDRIGIDADFSARLTTVAGATIAYWAPIKSESDPASAPTALGGSNHALAFNADIEPDADRDGFGNETQDQCVGTPGPFNGCPNTVTVDNARQKGTKPKVQVTATVPGAGTLKAGSPGDPMLASAAAVALKPVTQTITSTNSHRVTLTLKLTKSARNKLADRGKLRRKVKVVYTPNGGPAGSTTRKAKLKG